MTKEHSSGTSPEAVMSPPSSLQGRLNRLFAVTRPPRDLEREYRNTEVVEACKAAGKEISTSHLSELRRGVKTNPSKRVLEAIGWFFEVRAGYFTDESTAQEVEAELSVRQARLDAQLEALLKDREDLAQAAHELTQAIRSSGVRNMAHRGTSTGVDARARAAQMRALARLILKDDDEAPEDD
jgi:hypothetical protein